MSKKYIMLKPEEEAASEVQSTIKEMFCFGENSSNYRFPDMEVNEENQNKLQELVNEYSTLIEQEETKDLDLKSFFAAKQIMIEQVDEFEEPRDLFILLVYFKEVCKLRDFEPVAVIETFPTKENMAILDIQNGPDIKRTTEMKLSPLPIISAGGGLKSRS